MTQIALLVAGMLCNVGLFFSVRSVLRAQDQIKRLRPLSDRHAVGE